MSKPDKTKPRNIFREADEDPGAKEAEPKKKSIQPVRGRTNPRSRQHEDITLYRRAIVARLLNEGITSSVKIVSLLADPESEDYTINPNTDQPFGRATIENDIRQLEAKAREIEVIESRRAKVKALRARGMTVIEIQAALANPKSTAYTLNPRTGEPYKVDTIMKDVDWIRENLMVQVTKNIDEYRSNQLDELREIRRAAWAKNDLRVVLSSLEAEMRLMGTKLPDMSQVSITHSVDKTAKESLADKLERMMRGTMDGLENVEAFEAEVSEETHDPTPKE